MNKSNKYENRTRKNPAVQSLYYAFKEKVKVGEIQSVGPKMENPLQKIKIGIRIRQPSYFSLMKTEI